MCILVVEDEPIILMSAVEGLAAAGYEVMQAEHGPRALGLIARFPGHFTMLVTDHNLPPHAVTGADLVVHIRTLYPAIPIVIATATASAISDAFRARHAVHLLPKPYDTASLARMVGDLLGPPPPMRSASQTI